MGDRVNGRIPRYTPPPCPVFERSELNENMNDMYLYAGARSSIMPRMGTTYVAYIGTMNLISLKCRVSGILLSIEEK